MWKIFAVPRQIAAILAHPLNEGAAVRTVARWAGWQIGSRLLHEPILMPFVAGTRLAITSGMTGATGNIYFGLAEYVDMAFAAHLLEPGSLFVDVGANIGSYSILAAGHASSDVIAIEPIPKTFQRLQLNVRINDLGQRIETLCCGLGAETGTLRFIDNRDTTNRVAIDGEAGTPIPIRTLDDILDGRVPRLIKIDVEGFEMQVLKGSSRVLREKDLLGLIIENNEHSRLYGNEPDGVRNHLSNLGFEEIGYEPFSRKIFVSPNSTNANAIFVRNRAAVEPLVRAAPALQVNGRSI